MIIKYYQSIIIALLFVTTVVSAQTWHTSGKYEYYIEYNPVKSYAEAEAGCLNKNATLVVVKTKDVQQFLVNQIENLAEPPYSFYIGLKRLSSSARDFEWIDGTHLSSGYSNWFGHSEGQSSNTKDCVIMGWLYDFHSGYKWRGVECNLKSRYICQRTRNIPPTSTISSTSAVVTSTPTTIPPASAVITTQPSSPPSTNAASPTFFAPQKHTSFTSSTDASTALSNSFTTSTSKNTEKPLISSPIATVIPSQTNFNQSSNQPTPTDNLLLPICIGGGVLLLLIIVVVVVVLALKKNNRKTAKSSQLLRETTLQNSENGNQNGFQGAQNHGYRTSTSQDDNTYQSADQNKNIRAVADANQTSNKYKTGDVYSVIEKNGNSSIALNSNSVAYNKKHDQSIFQENNNPLYDTTIDPQTSINARQSFKTTGAADDPMKQNNNDIKIAVNNPLYDTTDNDKTPYLMKQFKTNKETDSLSKQNSADTKIEVENPLYDTTTDVDANSKMGQNIKRHESARYATKENPEDVKLDVVNPLYDTTVDASTNSQAGQSFKKNKLPVGPNSYTEVDFSSKKSRRMLNEANKVNADDNVYSIMTSNVPSSDDYYAEDEYDVLSKTG